ncbi:hypothetical protein DW322_04095 [Rhodococcus rhodnii]|uniref:Uncharacterized protein n=2 Tax=Rhodococcus rhodnii TaxID=38312 RepID=R7WGZ6_9NOCA|nr:DUF6474 family protein [Rhodococcus rhodnii]EOM74311.1 hypothetical protein Rrhod_4455 [Rhodococcus rhodnii LMG 5362]TXG89554.1 hypothetical protein DW322_04095 [Rhodococcus rhodnii]
MGLFGKRTSRATRRAEAKALTEKAKLEAKLTAKRLDKREKSAAKAIRKQAKHDRDADKRIEKARLEALEEQKKAAARQGLSAANVRRYLGIARVLAPVLLPIAYRAATAARGVADQRRASRMGIEVDQLSQFTGHGAKLAARIAAAETSVADVLARRPDDAEAQQFADATRTRLDELSTAVHAAEAMPPQRRKAAHRAIAHELDGVEADVLARLGVR